MGERAEPVAATPHEKAAWLLVAAALLLVFWLHLVPALVAALFVTGLLHRLARRMAGPRLSDGVAKVVDLIRFRGHCSPWGEEGVHDAEDPTAVSAAAAGAAH